MQHRGTVAEQIVASTARYRLASMLVGYLASLVLISAGIWFTQRDFAHTESGRQGGTGDISAKAGEFEFVVKNTAPGIVLILCGTAIVVVTIQRKSRAKTQWADEKNPGFTEVDG